MSNLDIVDIRDDIREDRGGVDQFNTDNMAGGQLTVLRETTARFENMLSDLSRSFFERGIAQIEQQILNGDAVINNPLKVGYLSQLGFDVSGGKIPKFFTDIFGDNETLPALQVATSFGYTEAQFQNIPAQAERIAAEGGGNTNVIGEIAGTLTDAQILDAKSEIVRKVLEVANDPNQVLITSPELTGNKEIDDFIKAVFRGVDYHHQDGVLGNEPFKDWLKENNPAAYEDTYPENESEEEQAAIVDNEGTAGVDITTLPGTGIQINPDGSVTSTGDVGVTNNPAGGGTETTTAGAETTTNTDPTNNPAGGTETGGNQMPNEGDLDRNANGDIVRYEGGQWVVVQDFDDLGTSTSDTNDTFWDDFTTIFNLMRGGSGSMSQDQIQGLTNIVRDLIGDVTTTSEGGSVGDTTATGGNIEDVDIAGGTATAAGGAGGNVTSQIEQEIGDYIATLENVGNIEEGAITTEGGAGGAGGMSDVDIGATDIDVGGSSVGNVETGASTATVGNVSTGASTATGGNVEEGAITNTIGDLLAEGAVTASGGAGGTVGNVETGASTSTSTGGSVGNVGGGNVGNVAGGSVGNISTEGTVGNINLDTAGTVGNVGGGAGGAGGSATIETGAAVGGAGGLGGAGGSVGNIGLNTAGTVGNVGGGSSVIETGAAQGGQGGSSTAAGGTSNVNVDTSGFGDAISSLGSTIGGSVGDMMNVLSTILGGQADATTTASGNSLAGILAQEAANRYIADKAAESQANVLAFQQKQYDDAIARMQPFYDMGVIGAQEVLPEYITAAKNDITYNEFDPFNAEDPTLRFLQDEMRRQVEASAAAGGRLNTGGTLTDLQDRSANIALARSGELQNINDQQNFELRERDRYDFKKLQDLIKDSQTAGVTMSGQDQVFSGLMTPYADEMYNAQAAGKVKSAQNYYNMFQNLFGG